MLANKRLLSKCCRPLMFDISKPGQSVTCKCPTRTIPITKTWFTMFACSVHAAPTRTDQINDMSDRIPDKRCFKLGLIQKFEILEFWPHTTAKDRIKGPLVYTNPIAQRPANASS
jgi:hypothetical protein